MFWSNIFFKFTWLGCSWYFHIWQNILWITSHKMCIICKDYLSCPKTIHDILMFLVSSWELGVLLPWYLCPTLSTLGTCNVTWSETSFQLQEGTAFTVPVHSTLLCEPMAHFSLSYNWVIESLRLKLCLMLNCKSKLGIILHSNKDSAVLQTVSSFQLTPLVHRRQCWYSDRARVCG